MRIRELVKTYRWLNDPSAPPWNVRFVGALVLFGVVAASVGGLYLATRVDDPATGTAASAAPPAAEVRTEYVGFPPGPSVLDSTPAMVALEAWKAQHADATILDEKPVIAPTGAIAGYEVRYYLP